MNRYLVVRRRVCEFVRHYVEFGDYRADIVESNALCVAVSEWLAGCSDAVAVLEEVLAARGVLLEETQGGEWRWKGIRVSPEVLRTVPWRDCLLGARLEGNITAAHA